MASAGKKGIEPLSDIFREVEEDVRRDRMEKLWKEYGAYGIALVALLFLAVVGYQGWQRYQQTLREKDSTAFNAAQRIENPNAAAKAFEDLSKTAGGGYVPLSRMEQANALARAGKVADAVTIYKDLAATDQSPIGSVARLRAGWALADSAKREELQTLLQPLLDAGGSWKPQAQEILAYSDYRTGKALVAASEFSQIVADPQASDVLKNRAKAFAVFLSTGGATNVGTVPPPAPVPAPGTPPDAQPGAPAGASAGAAAP